MQETLQSGSAQAQVRLGTGPPTFDELRVFYQPKFTWSQLKLFVNSGDLGLLKRDRTLQKRYSTWSAGIKEEYGSIVNYLQSYRLQWGKPDTLSLLKSQLEEPARPTKGLEEQSSSESKTYFTADIDPELISIIQNDWPYSVPLEVEHSLVWTKLPILPPHSLLIPSIAESLSPELREIISARLAQDGLWGFTGSIEPPPSPSLLPQSLGALSEWGITMDKLVVSARGAEDEELAIKRSGAEVQAFVANRWSEREWETCWFVNPPRLQSVKGLAHIHVFARKKESG